jgi:hypothetical protein
MPNTRSERNLNSMGDLMNLSFDGEYNVHVVEPLTLNPVTGSLERTVTIQGDAAYVLTYDGNNNMTQIEKTIGTTTYTKTFGYDGNNNLTSISVWS